ncbi:MAG: NUDIX domain-containing protein [bacterium]
MIERHCVRCGHLLEGEPPTCPECGHVHWRDPKVASCTIFRWQGGVFLTRRGIEPGYGRWTFPGGYVDRGETVEAAAVRETREETGCEVDLDDLLGLYSYPGQTAIIVVYRASVRSGVPHALHESLEAQTFGDGAIPWGELAFPSTREALRDFLAAERDPSVRGRSRNLR